MNHLLAKLARFIQHLLGLSMWQIEATQEGVKKVKMSHLGLGSLLIHLSIVTYCILTAEYDNDRSFNLSTIFNSEITETGELFRNVAIMLRFYSIYIASALFHRCQRRMYGCFLAADERLECMQQTIRGKAVEIQRSGRPRHYYLTVVRLVLLASIYWTVPFNRFIHAAFGCDFYRASLEKPIRTVIFVLMSLSSYCTIMDIVSSLAFVETRLDRIRQLIVDFDKKSV